MKAKPTIELVTATEAKNRFGDLIKAAYLHDQHLIVNRDGIPVVAVIPIDDYRRAFNGVGITQDSQDAESGKRTNLAPENLERMSLNEFLAAIHEQMGNVDEEELERDILEAVQEVRAEKHVAKNDG